MNEISGTPLRGRDLERLQGFLERQGLAWDEGIVHSVMLEDAGEVVACGSCRGDVIVCLAVDEARRGENLLGQVFSHLVGWLVGQGRTRWFCFTKPHVRPLVEALGMHALAQTDEAVMLESRREGLAAYLRQVARETEEQLARKAGGTEGRAREATCACETTGGAGRTGEADGAIDVAEVASGAAGGAEGASGAAGGAEGALAPRVGAIVANCNPLTLGHMHLIETAAAQVDVLHVFVLAAEQGFMPAADRLALVRQATADMPNVAVHSGGDYLISPATFPTYFHKDAAAGLAANCKLDVALFAQRIAPALGITARFVGTEPTCAVTGQYNACMAQLLPQAGIKLVVVERLGVEGASDSEQPTGAAISASTVRELVQKRDWQAIGQLVPACTLGYLTGRFGDSTAPQDPMPGRDLR